MTEVISVRFKNRGKVYFFDPDGITVENGERVIVETSKGLELGDCTKSNHFVEDEKIIPPLRPVIRIATQQDLFSYETNKQKESEAFEVCQQKISDHGLDMKLVDVEYNFEGNKILFFFTSDGRVDFRELVKDLASVFRMRIELRQIGVRDEAKMLGGLGICGRQFCCSQFLDEFQPVSTKMAKTQSMSLNPTKISGSCGRLMCCLRYEQEAYEDLIKSVPKPGSFVETPAGYGSVTTVNLLRRDLKVRIDGESDQLVKSYNADEVVVVPGGRPKEGEELPSLLAALNADTDEEVLDEDFVDDEYQEPILIEASSELPPPVSRANPKPHKNTPRRAGNPQPSQKNTPQPAKAIDSSAKKKRFNRRPPNK